MRSWRGSASLLLPLLLFLRMAVLGGAIETKMDQKDFQKCSGMYSRKSWGGSVDPFILTKFAKSGDIPEGEDPIVSLIIFEWRDRGLIQTDEVGDALICDKASVDAGSCKEEQLGEFMLEANVAEASKSEILTEAIHLNNPPAVRYAVRKTGYYCVVTNPFVLPEGKYAAVAEFRNAFGELPAAQIAKLPFYATITIVYAFLAIGWGGLYYLHRHDILAVQNYITAILGFLVIEMFMTWLFYDYQNRHGLNAGAKALLVIVGILSAGRNSFSFFLLLVVCMGYGVVRPTLGRTMIYVRWLAVAHFTFGILYSIASLIVAPENAGPLILLVVLPLAATLTAFYVWTLNSLNATMKDLKERKQTVKAGMYRKLWWCILTSIIVIFVFFFINSWTFAGTSQDDFVPLHWQNRWFILDGWLNLVYFFDVAFVAYVWRPTANNRRFAMSDEIAQDDDGFEIASIRDSFDIDLEDPEADGGISHAKPPGYDAPPNQQDYRPNGNGSHRDLSPLPAPVPQKPAQFPRESLEGDTIFALGEEDKDEDDDDDEAASESKRLTGGKRD